MMRIVYIVLSAILAMIAVWSSLSAESRQDTPSAPCMPVSDRLMEPEFAPIALDDAFGTHSTFMDALQQFENASLEALEKAFPPEALTAKQPIHVVLLTPETAPSLEPDESGEKNPLASLLQNLLQTETFAGVSVAAIFDPSTGQVIESNHPEKAADILKKIADAKPISAKGVWGHHAQNDFMVASWHCLEKDGKKLCLLADQPGVVSLPDDMRCAAAQQSHVVCDQKTIDTVHLLDAHDCALDETYYLVAEALDKQQAFSGTLTLGNRIYDYKTEMTDSECRVTTVLAHQSSAATPLARPEIPPQPTVDRQPTHDTYLAHQQRNGLFSLGAGILFALLGGVCTRRRKPTESAAAERNTQKNKKIDRNKNTPTDTSKNNTTSETNAHSNVLTAVAPSNTTDTTDTTDTAHDVIPSDGESNKRSLTTDAWHTPPEADKSIPEHGDSAQSQDVSAELKHEQSNDRTLETPQPPSDVLDTQEMVSSDANDAESDDAKAPFHTFHFTNAPSAPAPSPFDNDLIKATESITKDTRNAETDGKIEKDDLSLVKAVFDDEVSWDEIAKSFDSILMTDEELKKQGEVLSELPKLDFSKAELAEMEKLELPPSPSNTKPLSDTDERIASGKSQQDAPRRTQIGLSPIDEPMPKDKAHEPIKSSAFHSTTLSGLTATARPRPLTPSLLPKNAASQTQTDKSNERSQRTASPSKSLDNNALYDALRRHAKDFSQTNMPAAKQTADSAFDFDRRLSKSGIFSITGSRVDIAPVNDHAQYQKLYDEYIELSLQCGEPTDKFTLEQFVSRLAREKERLMRAYQCSNVRFSVRIKAGKPSLKATPMK